MDNSSPGPARSGWEFWIDRGGTFTDVIGRGPDGRETSAKLLSVSTAYEDAAVEAMRRLLGVAPGAPFPAHDVASIKLGTTVATNALLERNGARTLLVTTRGLADALTIGDQARPHLFDLDIVRPAPLHAGVIAGRSGAGFRAGPGRRRWLRERRRRLPARRSESSTRAPGR
jgi:5-oxoprolinase (ATP-hydrolysing)